MDLQLRGSRALVTGSTVGIGYAIAERLLVEGAEVWVNGRTQARVDAAVKSLLDRVPDARVHGAAGDLTTSAGVQAIVAAAPDIDILVNNAGVFEPRPFPEIDDAAWLQIFEINVMGGVRLSRAYIPKLLERSRGRIIFISSESGVQIPVEMIHYGVTKTAQIALARGLAEMTKGTGVTVNSVLAGPTLSERLGDFMHGLADARGISFETMEREFFTGVRPTSLLQRFEKPQEIAQVVAFLASDMASAINGAAIRADGGVVRSAF